MDKNETTSVPPPNEFDDFEDCYYKSIWPTSLERGKCLIINNLDHTYDAIELEVKKKIKNKTETQIKTLFENLFLNETTVEFLDDDFKDAFVNLQKHPVFVTWNNLKECLQAVEQRLCKEEIFEIEVELIKKSTSIANELYHELDCLELESIFNQDTSRFFQNVNQEIIKMSKSPDYSESSMVLSEDSKNTHLGENINLPDLQSMNLEENKDSPENGNILPEYSTFNNRIRMIKELKAKKHEFDKSKLLVNEIISTFKKFLTEKLGSMIDVNSLVTTFKMFKYSVCYKQNLNGQDMFKEIGRLTENTKEKDSVVLCILAHGNKEMVYGLNKETGLEIRQIIHQLSPLKSPILCGIPKLVFIAACRGDTADKGYSHHLIDIESNVESSVVPLTRDIFMAFPSFDGFKAQITLKGTYFLQSLCDILNKYKTSEISKLMPLVNRQVERRINQDDDSKDKEYDVVTYTSTLSRLFRFQSPEEPVLE